MNKSNASLFSFLICLWIVGLVSTNALAQIGPATATTITPIPVDAVFVYHRDGFVFTYQSATEITQLTFTDTHFEHVHVSPNRRYVVGNELAAGVSKLFVYDIVAQTRSQLLPAWVTAGEGGVSFGVDGFIYTSGHEFDGPPTDIRPIRIRPDGSGMQTLGSINGIDIGVSQDATMIAFAHTDDAGGPNEASEIWVANSDGSLPYRVYRGEKGQVGFASVHDPEFSTDKLQVVFSRRNPAVSPANFCYVGGPCDAHDLMRANLDGSGVTRLTSPGPINIIPNVQYGGTLILLAELADTPPNAFAFMGASAIDLNGVDQDPTQLYLYGSQPKFIPPYTADTSDTTTPVTFIGSPSAGATVQGGTAIAAPASDNIGVTKIEIFVDGLLKATQTGTAMTGFGYPWDTASATEGTHSLTSKAYDAAGNVTTSPAVTVTVKNQLLNNTGFENGTSGWTSSASGIIGAFTPYAGARNVKLKSTTSAGTQTVYQVVTIPSAGVSSANITFRLKIGSLETGAAVDTLKVEIRNASGVVLDTLAVYNNTQKTTFANYELLTLAIPGNRIGSGAYRLYFTGYENGVRKTDFRVDDVTVNLQ